MEWRLNPLLYRAHSGPAYALYVLYMSPYPPSLLLERRGLSYTPANPAFDPFYGFGRIACPSLLRVRSHRRRSRHSKAQMLPESLLLDVSLGDTHPLSARRFGLEHGRHGVDGKGG